MGLQRHGGKVCETGECLKFGLGEMKHKTRSMKSMKYVKEYMEMDKCHFYILAGD